MSKAWVTDGMLQDELTTLQQRVTREQLQFYNQFCKKHPELLERRRSQTKQELWTHLTQSLNVMNGPTRSICHWKETFARWRCSQKGMRRIKWIGNGPRSAAVTGCEEQTLETGAGAVGGVQKIETMGCKKQVNSKSQHESEVSDFEKSDIIDEEEAETAEVFPSQNPRTAVTTPDNFEDYSAKPRKVTLDNMFTAAMEAMRQRSDLDKRNIAEREELTRAINRMCNQQEQVAKALQQMNHNVMVMTQAVENLSDLGNRLYEDYHLFE